MSFPPGHDRTVSGWPVACLAARQAIQAARRCPCTRGSSATPEAADKRGDRDRDQQHAPGRRAAAGGIWPRGPGQRLAATGRRR